MDCDNVVFSNDAPTFPTGAPIISYTQRNSGQQAIPTQVSRRGEEINEEIRNTQVHSLSAVSLKVFAACTSYANYLCVLLFQSFANSNLPLKKLDFSYNAIRRLADKVFAGIQEELMELHLTDNLLGDSLNPIFATSELHALTNLRILHLSGNKIKAIEEGILKGCEKLQVIIRDIRRICWLNVHCCVSTKQ